MEIKDAIKLTVDLNNLNNLNDSSSLTSNVQQNYIITTYDKLRLALIEYEENRKLSMNWWSYLAMTLSFALPCFSSEFHSFLFLSASQVESFFVIMTILLFGLTIISVIKRFRNRKMITIEYCVNLIRNSDLKK